MSINLRKTVFITILFSHFFVLPLPAASGTATKKYTVPFTSVQLTRNQVFYAAGITSYLAITALLYSYDSIRYKRAFKRQKNALERHQQEGLEKKQKTEAELKEEIKFQRALALQPDKKREHIPQQALDLNNLPQHVLKLLNSYAEPTPAEQLTLAGAFLSCTKGEFDAALKRINSLILTGWYRSESNLYGELPPDDNLIIAVIHELDPVTHFNVRTHIGGLWREAGLLPRTILHEHHTGEARQLLVQQHEQEKNRLLTTPASDDPTNTTRRTLTDAELTAKRQRLTDIAKQFSTSNDHYESHIYRLLGRVPNPGKYFIAIKAQGEKMLMLHKDDRDKLEALTAEQIELIQALHTLAYSAKRTVHNLSTKQFATFKTLPLSMQTNLERFLNKDIRMRSLSLLFTNKCTQVVVSFILLRTIIIFSKFFCLELASLMAQGTIPETSAAAKTP